MKIHMNNYKKLILLILFINTDNSFAAEKSENTISFSPYALFTLNYYYRPFSGSSLVSRWYHITTSQKLLKPHIILAITNTPSSSTAIPDDTPLKRVTFAKDLPRRNGEFRRDFCLSKADKQNLWKSKQELMQTYQEVADEKQLESTFIVIQSQKETELTENTAQNATYDTTTTRTLQDMRKASKDIKISIRQKESLEVEQQKFNKYPSSTLQRIQLNKINQDLAYTIANIQSLEKQKLDLKLQLNP
jgi:hypothetical protein